MNDKQEMVKKFDPPHDSNLCLGAEVQILVRVKLFFIDSYPTRYITKWDHEILLNSSLDSKSALDVHNC